MDRGERGRGGVAMRIPIALILLAAFSARAFAEAAPGGVSFKEGVGLELDHAVREQLELETVEVREAPLVPALSFTAQIFRESRESSQARNEPTGFAYASAWVEARAADRIRVNGRLSVIHRPDSGCVVSRIDRSASDAKGRVELILRLEDGETAWRIGEFARVSADGLAEKNALVVPRSAVLDTAYGAFVYVVNGTSYLRTPIKAGATREGTIEIADGLYP